MSERSETRRELERAIRDLLPDQLLAKSGAPFPTPTAAAAGMGGLFTGYLWGWIRGRRGRSRRQR